MVTAFDIQKYERCKEIASEYDISISVIGGCGFALKRAKKNYCTLPTVDELFSYLCGYSAGKDEAN